MPRQAQGLYDRQITIFSPEGKLYQVEYAFRAVKGCNLTALAVIGADTVCAVVQKKIPTTSQTQQDKLIDESYITSVHDITEKVGGVMIGLTGDCNAMVSRGRQIAWEFNYAKGYEIPPGFLCYKIANLNQMYTQHAYMRLHACTGILIGIDDEKGPCIYRFDPAGWYASFRACAAGAKEQEAMNILEKLIKKKPNQNETDTIQSAISALQSVLSVDFKPRDVEVCVVTRQNPKFRRLGASEIDEHLTAIAERG